MKYKPNKVKNNVRAKTRYAISKGFLVKKVCEVCGGEKVQAHHADYSKPYDVKWLCQKHHSELHSEDKIFRAIMVELDTCLKFRELAKKSEMSMTDFLKLLLSKLEQQ
jgi:hypothetical protein